MPSLPMSKRIARLTEELIAEGVHLNVEVTPPRPDLDMRVTLLTNKHDPEESIHIIELDHEIIVQFGHNLRMELESIESDMRELESLLRAILFHGYTEEVWIRGNHVIHSKSVINYNGHFRKMSTRTLGGKWNSKKVTVIHKPWI